jgi:hypothetical protein
MVATGEHRDDRTWSLAARPISEVASAAARIADCLLEVAMDVLDHDDRVVDQARSTS